MQCAFKILLTRSGTITNPVKVYFLPISGFVPKLIFLFGFSFLTPITSFGQGENRVIREIEIERRDVFNEEDRRPQFLYNWANQLHIVTRERVIRRELLFKPGDIYDLELLEESERKLRALSYFGEVTVAVKDEEEQFVDVLVTTQDQWSTLVSYIFERGGGRTTFGGALEEFNFLGLGKKIFAELRHEVSEGAQLTLRYTDTQLLGSRWTTKQTFITGPFVKSFSANIVRPFYSLDTKWAYGVAGFVDDRTLRFFDRSIETNRYHLQSGGFQVLGARAFGSRFHKKRLQLVYSFTDRDFSSLTDLTTGEIPDDELVHSMTLTTSFENVSFVEETQIDKFVRTEDLTLGNVTSMSLGRTGFPIPQGARRFQLSATRTEAHRFFDKQYVFLTLRFQTLFEKDTIASLRLRYYNKMTKRQTLACNFAFDYADNLEARQFLLGGDSGLRGYPAREFSGDKRFLINIEDRIFTPLNILTVALGGVLFLDAGNVWKEGESVNLFDLNYSVGFGLRLGYTKSPDSRVGRIDFAWALSGDGGFGVVFGVDQIFSLN